MRNTTIPIFGILVFGVAVLSSASCARTESENETTTSDGGDMPVPRFEEWTPDRLYLAHEEGNVGATTELANRYRQGRGGVAKDEVEAFRLYQLLANQGFAQAQAVLGYMYGNGYGVPEDDVEAVRLYRLAAEQGYAPAQVNLGIMYENGEGVPQDDVEAARLYGLAAKQGSADGQQRLAYLYQMGTGVPQDFLEGARYTRLAAEQGIVNAQFNMGMAYNNGEGVPQDDVLAYMWFNLAARDNKAPFNSNALDWRDKSMAKLSREQIAEAQRLAREWIEAHP